MRSKPVLTGALNGGRSNQSFLLDSDIGKLVLRINAASSLLPGASRDNEVSIWQAASQQGIAPPLVYVEPQNQYHVSTYINNDLPTKPQLNQGCVDQVFDLLNRCHRLDINAPCINYFDHIEHYWQIIEARKSEPSQHLVNQRKPIQLLLESLLASNTPTGLCHHDPVIANFVGTTERLYLIDWEYASSGLQIMDYAALAIEWQINDATVQKHTGIEQDSLSKARTIYRYLHALWEEIAA